MVAQRARDAYNQRMLRADADSVVLDAVKEANARHDQEAAASKAQLDDGVRHIAASDPTTLQANIQGLASFDLQKKLHNEAETARLKEIKERDTAILQVARARLYGTTDVCEVEMPDGTTCGKPLGRNSVMCKGHRAYQMRKPSSMGALEWEEEKRRRKAQRFVEEQEKRERLQEALHHKITNKKLKRTSGVVRSASAAVPPVPASFVESRSAASLAPFLMPDAPSPTTAFQNLDISGPLTCSTCLELIDAQHVVRCPGCEKVTHDVVECINPHKEYCTRMDQGL